MSRTCSSSLTESARRMPASSNSGILPLDVLFDVLVWLSAKELCRLHVICRPWQSLTSDPIFIKAHTAHHREPLLLASFKDDEPHIHIMDLAGNVLKQIGIPVGHKVLCTCLDLVCVTTEKNSCHVLNPATRAVYDLPESPADGACAQTLHLICIWVSPPRGSTRCSGCSTVLDLQTLSSISSVKSLLSRMMQAMHVGGESRAMSYLLKCKRQTAVLLLMGWCTS